MAIKATRARIIPISHYDDGRVLSKTSQAQNFAVERLLTQQPRETWRSTNTATQTIVFDPQQQVEVSAVYLGNTNATINAMVTITIANHPSFGASRLLYQWTGDLRSPVFGLGEDRLGFDGLGGYSDDGWQSRFSVHWLEAANLLNGAALPLRDHCFVKISISDSDNGAGYIELGRFMAGAAFAPGRDVDIGPSLVWRPNTDLIRTRGGALRSNARPAFREISLAWTLTDDDDAFNLVELQRLSGARRAVLVSIWPEEGTTRERLWTVYGRISDASPLQINAKLADGGLLYRANLTIAEAL